MSVHSLSDLRNKEQEEESGKEGQVFYAGGPKGGSGIAIQGPPSSQNNNQNSSFFDRIFGSKQQKQQQGEGEGEGSTDPNAHHVTVIMWRNGFQVQEHPAEIGPLRGYNEPNSKEFIESLQKNELPKEFRAKKAAKSAMTFDFELIDRRSKDFEQTSSTPTPKIVPFSGSGMRLGGSTSTTTTTKTSNTATPTPNSKTSEVVVDESKPITQIQIRLTNGKKLIGRFNETNTISDLRDFVNRNGGGGNNGNYDLLSTANVPPKVLSDFSQTLSQAGILNSGIIQRFH